MGNTSEYNRKYYLKVTSKKARAKRSTLRQGHCAYCGAFGKLAGDHVIPRSAGGSDESKNIRESCEECNKSKSKLSLERWRATLARRLMGSPYFQPWHIRFLLSQGFDLVALFHNEAKSLRFYFEGGDGKKIRVAVEKKSLRGY